MLLSTLYMLETCSANGCLFLWLQLTFRKLPSVLLLLEYFVGWSTEFAADSVAPGYGRTIVSGDRLLEVVGVVGGAAMHLLAGIVALLLSKGMAERSVLADAVWFQLRLNLICNFDCLSMDLEGFAVRWSSPILGALMRVGQLCSNCLPARFPSVFSLLRGAFGALGGRLVFIFLTFARICFMEANVWR
ncbi:hypothetical protein Nepgr_024708 [Nepenthes gracilis]|uniref:Uncharacterized protein n=1 Tax=Nepenthes gracilis TaxID=150966 RepID=A0AAD3T3R8_NEPGR|nr:hypothetical protein Nepgr_024708 [Nepenthes gracilis]